MASRLTSRQKVDQWAQRHSYWPVTYAHTFTGPEHDRRYVVTCTLNNTTSFTGDEKRSIAESKETAAMRAFVVCQNWEAQGYADAPA